MLACIEGLFFYHLLDWVESKAFRLINAPNLTSPLQLRRDVAFLFIFYNYYFNCCSEDLGYCVPGPNNWWRNTRVASFSQEFCVEACHFRFDLENSCLFPHTVNLWNSFPSSIFSSSYNFILLFSFILILFLVLFLIAYTVKSNHTKCIEI